MFLELSVPIVVLMALLLIPGALVLRSFRFPWSWSFCLAPIVSIGMLCLLGEICAFLNLVVSSPLLAGLLLALPGLCLFTFSALFRERGDLSLPHFAWWLPVLAVAIGLFVCNNVFLSKIDSVDGFPQYYDVLHHINTIQAISDSGFFSSLGVSPYLSAEDAAIMPYGIVALYPAAWHVVCALLKGLVGVSVPIVMNASFVVFTGVVLPLGLLAWASLIFSDSPLSVFPLAFLGVSFAAFPWVPLLFGPLYPNMAGFAALPAFSCLFMLLIRPLVLRSSLDDVAPAPVLPSLLVPLALAFLGQGLLHPNTVISSFLILSPYFMWVLFRYVRDARGFSVFASAAICLAFIAFCVGLWIACYHSPLFSDIVGEHWRSFAYSWQEVINILTQSYTFGFYFEISAQVIIGLLVIIGWVRCIYDKSLWWLAIAYLLVSGIAFVGATSSSVELKQFVAGFWYTDPIRLSAMSCIVAMLLASHGFAWVYEQACFMVRSYNERQERKTHPRLIAVVLSCLFLIANFMPGFNWPGAHYAAPSNPPSGTPDLYRTGYYALSVKTTFGDYRQLVRDVYLRNRPLDNQELEFIREVSGLVPGDALIINNPMDGSLLTYGSMGLRIYYRTFGYAGGSTETPESILIRNGLCNIASDSAVRGAVESIGAKYVLVMNEQNSSGSFINLRGDYSPGDFLGISSITYDTPGFTPVLSNGACTLYRID